jgi:hypothetical protein
MSVRDCEGLPVHARIGVGSTKQPGPHGLRFSFGDAIRLALSVVRGARSASSCDVLVRVRSVVGLLSWGCQRSAPPSTSVPGVHSQWSRCSGELPLCVIPRDSASRRGATFDPVLPIPGFVPPLPFLPTSTVCSTWHFAGLLHPAADPGVRHVSGLSSRSVSPDLPVRRGGGRSRFVGASSSLPKKLPVRVLSPTLSPGSCVPGGALSLVRRGLPSFLLDLSRWRSTLRSFSLASSCAASTVPSCRVPGVLPCPGEPGRGVVPGALVGLSVRATAVVAFSPLFAGSSSSLRPVACARGLCGVASAGRSTSRLSSADESVASTRCCNPVFARCSLGLRPSKACLHDEGAVGRSTGAGVGAPLPLLRFGVETRRLCRGALGASVPAGRSPSSLASQLGVQVRASLTEPPSWLAPCPAGCPAGVRYRRPDRHLLPRECRPEGRRQVPHPVACLHHGRVVIVSRFLRRAPSRARGRVGRTVRVRRRSRSPMTPARGLSSSVRRCLAPPASAASCLGRGPSLVGPSLRRAEASTCGAEPRSEALRRVPVPPSPASSCPGARWGVASACQPKLTCCEVPRRHLPPRRVGRCREAAGPEGPWPALALVPVPSRGTVGPCREDSKA